ncbi:MAG: cold shock domain-containing protein [Anaerolineae bacterium]|nr:cold shock domain-containing protein [Anaerolineae bacterium]
MSYSDEFVVCEQCGKKFVFSIEEQRRQAELGFDIVAPDTCPDCRQLEASVSPGLKAGIVKWYRDDKGFGFIVQQDGSEVFFHRTGVTMDDMGLVLKEEAPVWYELIMTDRGPQAVNIHLREV